MAKFMMIDENVRRRLFWLLQRLSSYTLWKRKRDAWALFAEKYEEALKNWPEEKTSGFDPKGIINIYDALHLYDEGLAELATGNRQVWQRKTGAFHQLARPVDLVESFFGPLVMNAGCMSNLTRGMLFHWIIYDFLLSFGEITCFIHLMIM